VATVSPEHRSLAHPPPPPPPPPPPSDHFRLRVCSGALCRFTAWESVEFTTKQKLGAGPVFFALRSPFVV